MDPTGSPARRLGLIVGILIAVGLLITAAIGLNASHQREQLTRRFEACMETAPFKTSVPPPRPEAVLSAAELQQQLDSFDRIQAETGLPPIWNGSTLVPWTQFHRESIDVARACHDALGIEHPQRQLKGTYAKPAWDPHSAIWTDP